ncbi:DUF305 domain-containing protein [Polaromonas sp.]|uniref:DUF305 domain-containing protein n=1 Tax=Polaromonas sp. TaxID=1869339 RepID=UPI0035651FA0
MTTNFKYVKPGPIAFIALTVALLQPLAYAHSPAMTGSDSMQGGKAGSSSMSGGAMSMKGMDMKGMMEDNNDKMSSMQMTGNSDIDFAMTMRMHHQGAIDMAEAELRDGKEPQMRKMAKDIIAAQKKEISQFDKFLVKHPAGKIGK